MAFERLGDGLGEGVKVLSLGGEESAVHVGSDPVVETG